MANIIEIERQVESVSDLADKISELMGKDFNDPRLTIYFKRLCDYDHFTCGNLDSFHFRQVPYMDILAFFLDLRGLEISSYKHYPKEIICDF